MKAFEYKVFLIVVVNPFEEEVISMMAWTSSQHGCSSGLPNAFMRMMSGLRLIRDPLIHHCSTHMLGAGLKGLFVGRARDRLGSARQRFYAQELVVFLELCLRCLELNWVSPLQVCTRFPAIS